MDQYSAKRNKGLNKKNQGKKQDFGIIFYSNYIVLKVFFIFIFVFFYEITNFEMDYF